MEGGEPQERWSVGTVNQYSQGEAMGTGRRGFLYAGEIDWKKNSRVFLREFLSEKKDCVF